MKTVKENSLVSQPKFLLSAHTGLGNFIQKTPMLTELHREFPNALIDVVGGGADRAEACVQGVPFIGDIHQFDCDWSLFEKLYFYFKLRRISYDAVFVAFDDESRFLFFGSLFCGAKKIYCHVNTQNKISLLIKAVISILVPRVELVSLLPSRHEIDLNLDLYQAYIGRPFKRRYKTLCGFSDSQSNLGSFGLEKDSYIVIQPGARSGAPTPKRWSLAKFSKFIQIFEERFPDVKVVAIGNQYDFDNYIATLQESHHDLINTAGLTTVAEAADIMRNATVSIVHDSGAMHIGGAVEAKMIALYGPTDFTRTRPLGANCTVLFSKQDSFAEMFNFSSGEDILVEKYGEDYCMDGIAPEDVLAAVETYLS